VRSRESQGHTEIDAIRMMVSNTVDVQPVRQEEQTDHPEAPDFAQVPPVAAIPGQRPSPGDRIADRGSATKRTPGAKRSPPEGDGEEGSRIAVGAVGDPEQRGFEVHQDVQEEQEAAPM